jgi:hypothetical protein
MANFYPYLDGGTVENYPNNVENWKQNPGIPGAPSPSNPLIFTNQRSTAFAHGGVASFKGIFKNFRSNPAIFAPNYFCLLASQQSNEPRLVTTIADAGNFHTARAGRRFRITCWVYIPSSNPIASDDAHVYLNSDASDTGGASVPNNGNSYAGITILARTQKSVAECLDTWTLFEWEFICGADDATSGRGFINVSLHVIDSTRRLQDVPNLPYIFTGTMNPDGEIYVDDISFEEILQCNLASGSPAYSKINETSEGAGDGSITANFTSSFTIQYSIDGTNYQASNTFAGLEPGTYTIFIKDSNDCTAELDNIVILAGGPVPDPPTPDPGPIIADSKPINQYNFISWMNASGPATTYTEIDFENCCWDIPRGYDRQDKSKMIHAPIVVQLEDFSFYINADMPFTDPDFQTYRLGLVNPREMVAVSIGNLAKHAIDDGTYNIYCDAVTIPSGTPPGYYRMIIYRQDTNAVLYLSNVLEVMLLDDAKCNSVVLQYKNGVDFYKYYYTLVPDYINKIRMRMYRSDEQPEGTLTQYRAISTGVLRNVSYELDKMLKLETYWFDDNANRAMFVFQAHGFLTINNFFYLVKTPFKWTFDQRKRCNKGTIEFYEQAFSSANRYAPLTDITVVGSGIPLLLGDGGAHIAL